MYYDTQSLENVLKPECLLASEMNGAPLTEEYGAPLRLRVENQLGYKMVKWIEHIEFVESEKQLGEGEGGTNEDHEYFDELPNILIAYTKRAVIQPANDREEISMALVKNRQRPSAKKPAHNQQITEIAGNIAHAAVIKEGDVFFLCQPTGDVPLNNASGLGLYYHDCRYLNGYQFRINSKKPNSLLTSAADGFMAKLEFSNPALEDDGKTVSKQQIGISCRRVIDSKTLALHDAFAFRNFGLQPARFTVEFSFSSRFDNILDSRSEAEKTRQLASPSMEKWFSSA